MYRPETHEILRDWHFLANGYDPPRLLLGEAYSLEFEEWASYYGDGDELDLAFAFVLTHADLDAAEMRSVVAQVEHALPADAWACWTGSNHDIGRFASRWAKGDEALARCALVILLGLRGTPCLYYGDELALTSGEVLPDRILDVASPSRDPGRTPMPWTSKGGWRDPWLPLTDTSRNVRTSARTLPRRCASPAISSPCADDGGAPLGSLRGARRADGTWAWRRGDGVLVAVNLGPAAAVLADAEGSIAISTNRGRDGEQVSGRLELAAAEGAIVVA
jgi:alpha-glucosidase